MDEADDYASVLESCGDNAVANRRMEMWLTVRDGRVREITFWTDGCSATIAWGSMTTEISNRIYEP